MELRFKDRNTVEINDARIIYPNFAGAPTKFNPRGGDRDFHIVIPTQELAEELLAEGYNVKIRAPREEGEEPFRYMKIKVNFGGFRPPAIYVESGSVRRTLDEETVGELDRIRIKCADMDIRPYDWVSGNGEGRTAYLQSIYVVQDVDRFADRYQEC